MIDSIPSTSGSYCLQMRLDDSTQIEVGRLGIFPFPAGHYFYCGSAHGGGGLRSRLGRHLAGNGRLHWHIDYLRQSAAVSGFGYRCGGEPLECAWSQSLATLPDARVVVPHFGAGDCRRACPAHLIYFSKLSAPLDQNGLKWREFVDWRNV